MSGVMYVLGDPDRPPVRMGFPQSYLLASAEAAVGTLIAHHWRIRNGEGQQVDVSIQAAVARCTYRSPMIFDLNQTVLHRGSGMSPVGEVFNKQIWPCKDGYILWQLYGPNFKRYNIATDKWVDEEGMANDYIRGTNWEEFAVRTTTQEIFNLITEPIANFFMTHTKAELMEGAIKHRFLLFPIADAKTIFDIEQLRARG